MQTPYLETAFAGPAPAGGTRFAPGARIGERFVVKHALRGGMGEVYLSYDAESRRPVALKTFRSELARDPRIHSRLRREVANWVSLGRHANIVQCLGLETIDTLPFILMEWVVGEAGQGVSLRERLQRGRMPLADALQIAIDLCRGLMHAARVSPDLVHRDVKPENVLITGARVARLADFGLAVMRQELLGTDANPLSRLDYDIADRRAARSEKKGLSGSMSGWRSNGFLFLGNHELDVEVQAGTPGYRSPEQARSRELDPRSDVFSLACTIHEMLAGFTPAEEGNARGALSPAVPQALREILLACLEERPENRPTAGALHGRLCALHEAETGRPARIDDTPEASVYEAGSRSVCLTQLGRHEEALAECRTALALQPHNASLHSLCGAILDNMGQCEEAVGEFSAALALDRTFAGTYVNRGLAYLRMGRPDDALADYTRAIALSSGVAEAYLNRASIHLARGDDAAALADLHRGVELSPKRSEGLLARAAFFFMRNRHEEAFADYERAAEVDPGSAAACIGKANVHFARGDGERALEELDRALELDPCSAMAYRNIGVILHDQGELERALWYIEKAVELGDAEAKKFASAGHQERASWYRARGERREACAEYAQAMAFDPADPAPRFNRATLHAAEGRLENALRDFTEGLRLDPSSAQAHRDRATVFMRMGREREAFADYDRAIALAPDDAANYFERANAHHHARRMAAALADYAKALALEPGLAAALLNMGVAYSKLGELRQAHELFARAAAAGDLTAARFARGSAEDLGIVLPPPPHYPVEAAWLRFVGAGSDDELRQAIGECPMIVSEAFTDSVETLFARIDDPETRDDLRARLSLVRTYLSSRSLASARSTAS